MLNARLGVASDVLDVGTGSGYLANLLVECGHQVIGIDTSIGMIRAARRSGGGARFVHGDSHAPGLCASSVDAVVSRYLLWTLADPVSAAREWSRLLRPGGAVIAADATWFSDGIDPTMKVPSGDGEEAFVRTYSPETLASLPLATVPETGDLAAVFREAGFTSVTVDDLPRVAELDRRFGVAPGHESRPHFVVTARE